MIARRLRFADLLALGLVNNRETLKNWIKKRGFPPGQLTGPNSRTWGEDEVRAWLDSRPTKPKAGPVVTKPPSEWKGRVGRPRKAERDATTP
jgi:predicted DNA-binding transcriptional regulator AlpA